MKSHPKIAALLPLAAMFFATAFAVTNASAKDIHIKGPMEATEDHVVTPPNMVTQLQGVGHARAIGRYALTIEATIYLPTRTGLGGTFEIDTGCGQTFYGTEIGGGVPTQFPNQVSITETLTITGGTGRFEGATGTLMIHRLIDQATLVSSGTIEGTLTLPDRHRCGGRR